VSVGYSLHYNKVFMYKLSILAISALILSACVNPSERFFSSCMNYGFVEGTPEFAQCMQNESMAYGRSMQAIAASNRPTHTNCNYVGDFMNCTSY